MSATWGVGEVRKQHIILCIAALVATAAVCTGVSLNSSGVADKNSGLIQGIKTDKESYPLGACVKFSYAIRNTGSRPDQVYLQQREAVRCVGRARRQGSLQAEQKDDKCGPWPRRSLWAAARPAHSRAVWDQLDNGGNQVGPGVYNVYAQLTPTRDAPPVTSSTVRIGGASPVLIPASIWQIVGHGAEFAGQRFQIHGTYKGTSPNTSDPNTKEGPPVTANDWILCDSSGCMYVTGAAGFDSKLTVGANVTVSGKVATSPKGEVYLEFENGRLE